MNGLSGEAQALVTRLAGLCGARGGVEVLVCPPFTVLGEVTKILCGSEIAVGGQNLYWEDKGAFTGEISGPMLRDLGLTYVIVGHSERRQFFGETDDTVRKRLMAAVRNGLRPILCVGETWEEREAGRTQDRIAAQLQGALSGAGGALPGLAVAYEPVWAIGTGRAASGADAQEVAAFIRRALGRLLGEEVAAATRILYGGSVKPDNIADFARQPDIDGALVGGASLDAGAFAAIVREFA